MLHCFDSIREINLLSVTIRLVLAVICGGLIGMEREVKRRPAGFRTHILISMGAAITILTNLYLYTVMHLHTDISRMGAQVITGIGFVGAGAIIISQRQRTKGLTTAAGLWTSSIIGLACGAGYVEMACFATLMVLVAEVLLSKLEYRFARNVSDQSIHIVYKQTNTLRTIVTMLNQNHLALRDMEVNRFQDANGDPLYSAQLLISIPRDRVQEAILTPISGMEDVLLVEEME